MTGDFRDETPHSIHLRRKAEIERLLDTVADRLRPDTLALARELVEANESPIAVDMVSEALDEAGVGVPSDVRDAFEVIGRGLGLDATTWERLDRA